MRTVQKRARAGWFGLFQRQERVERGEHAAHEARPAFTAYRSAMERYPTHSCVVLADGQLMYVRHASLAAAKDLLAAQRAAERRTRTEAPAAPPADLADLADLSAESARG